MGTELGGRDMFPESFNQKEYESSNLSIQAFGKRLYKDQTVYEYLLEFLLVFCSPKEKIVNGERTEYRRELSFHKNNNQLQYYANPRIGLKRFIFFEKSKREGKFPIDRENYHNIKEMLKESIHIDGSGESEDFAAILQDAFYGFSAILKNRSWFAQSLLPIAPELIFCESIGNKGKRTKLALDAESNKTEKDFEFTQHSFMARGGELYYLSILLGLEGRKELREPLEKQLYQLVHAVGSLGQLGEFIQKKWEVHEGIQREKQMQKYVCDFIPKGYKRRAEYNCQELVNLLSASLNELDKIEYLGMGMMLQIFRMMHEQACIRAGIEEPVWLLDVSRGNKNIRKMSEQSFLEFGEALTAANIVGLQNIESIRSGAAKYKKYEPDETFEMKLKEDAEKNTFGVVKALGKEICFVVPKKGASERMTLSEDLISFLVMALLKPNQKVTLDTFYQKLYEHYGIVIGGKQSGLYSSQKHIGQNYEIDFRENEKGFLQLLRDSGYLRELSDATAIVMNPYEGNRI